MKMLTVVPFDTDHRSPNGGSNKVWIIKAIRAITHVGLKEAKELTEAAMVHPVELPPIVVTAEQYRVELINLKDGGGDIVEVQPKLQEELKELIHHAVNEGDTFLAIELLQVYQRSFKNE